MYASEFPRRWSATITVSDNPLGLYVHDSDRYSETVQADESEEDLQRSQAKAAYAEACQYLLARLGQYAEVQLYKTTKKHGTVKSYSTSLDANDAVAWAMKALVNNSTR
jgi:hypothetical protein